MISFDTNYTFFMSLRAWLSSFLNLLVFASLVVMKIRRNMTSMFIA